MTTKPRARRYRVRQGSGAAAQAAQEKDAATPREQTIEEIEREGLTARQLRIARRLAQKHGLGATSDLDAVRLLRARGIDPFNRESLFDIVADPEGEVESPDNGDAGPAPAGPSPAERRLREIAEIQRDIARRRRRRVAMLAARLLLLVLLPTALAGYYFYRVATPMYATKSAFLILKADSGGSGLGSLFSGTQFATNQDAIAVQSYLTSKDAMLRLDEDAGFRAHFSQPFIDPLQRLPQDATTEDAYRAYKKNVRIGYDPTEGVIKMEVSAFDSETAADFSRRLIAYAEERVDNLSRRKRENQLADARRAVEDAEARRREAQEALVRLQQENQMIDPAGRIAILQQKIGLIEQQKLEKELELDALLDNARPNQAKVEGVRADIRRLTSKLEELNAEMTARMENGTTLAELNAAIKLAEADLAARDMMLQSAVETLEQTRRDALSQARYLTTSVVPVPSESPSYPRKFENTVLAFFVFAGLYLTASLTASILREQVSS